ncbi:hypothetical protein GHA01_20380 [Novacetimonas hansenii]|uniref:Uncharacterized protein n=2 Tax=Novacetimonas hansenii TaxID=436 RepID=A0ABQ0SG27_NOVHA|nr:hypothetical protein AA0243_3018 [Novacetimonas hansenii NRIC 0243]GEC64189.1 hypothetical protein GHA01_20380 [Novacetimonas hansenii]
MHFIDQKNKWIELNRRLQKLEGASSDRAMPCLHICSELELVCGEMASIEDAAISAPSGSRADILAKLGLARVMLANPDASFKVGQLLETIESDLIRVPQSTAP